MMIPTNMDQSQFTLDEAKPRPKAKDNKHIVYLVEIGYQVEDLAEFFGVTTKTMRNYISGSEPCPVATILIAEALIKRAMPETFILAKVPDHQKHMIMTLLDGLKVSYSLLP